MDRGQWHVELARYIEKNLRACLQTSKENEMTPAGLEPAIPGSVGRCLIHWATGPLDKCPEVRIYLIDSYHAKRPRRSHTLEAK
jgi:hypothetical protein